MNLALATNRVLKKTAGQFDHWKRTTQAGVGWGQFIDQTTQHTQIGPYGTASALIVIKLARGVDSAVQGAASELANQWRKFRNGDTEQLKLFPQTPRLAWHYLALSMAGDQFDQIAQEIRTELIARTLANSSWGDWWISPDNHDSTPRGFSTSLVQFCLNFKRPPTPDAIQWANRQQSIPLDGSRVPTIEVLLNAIVVLQIANATNTLREFQKELKKKSWRELIDSNELALYFYDYQYTSKQRGKTKYGREYFIIPIRLLAIIAGTSPYSPALLKVAALSSARSLVNNLDEQGGLYRQFEGGRASSLNQAWAAVAAEQASQSIAHKGGKVLWWLWRQRKSSLVDKYLPFAVVIIATGLASFAPDQQASKVAVAFCTLVLGWLYSGSISKLVQGR